MKTPKTLAGILLASVALLAPPMTVRAAMKVVATTPDLGTIASTIGGDLVHVDSLAKTTEDVHFVDPKPSYVVKLAHADMLIEGGAELEVGWLPPLLEGARNAKLDAGQPGRVACAEGLPLLEVPSARDRAKGDIHALGNPHFMVDPENGRHAAQRICAALCEIDPTHKQAYEERYQSFTNRLDQRLVVWRQTLAPFVGRRMVSFHNAWPYFARSFGLKIDLFLEPKPGIPPTPAHLEEVVNHMKAERIGVILVEPFQNRKTAETIAGRTGAVLVDFTQYPGGVKGSGPGYIELMDYLVETLAKALHNGTAGETKP